MCIVPAIRMCGTICKHQKNIENNILNKYHYNNNNKLMEKFDLTFNIDDKDIIDLYKNGFPETTERIRENCNITSCPNCLSQDAILSNRDQGIVECTNCGQVIEGMLDDGAEWKHQQDTSKPDNARCTKMTNVLLPQSSLGINIEVKGNGRLKKLHNWGRIPYKERSLGIVFGIISQICAKGHILKCVEDDAKIMFKNIHSGKHFLEKKRNKNIILRGKNRIGLIGACIYFACKKNNKIRTPKEIAELCDIETTELNKGCKFFIKTVSHRKTYTELTSYIDQTNNFVSLFCTRLNLNREYMDLALKINKNIMALGIVSIHTPISIAIACILIMANHTGLKDINRRSMSDMFKVSEVIVSKTYKRLEPFKNALIDDKLSDLLVKKINGLKKHDSIPLNILEKCRRFGVNNKDNPMFIYRSENNELDERHRVLVMKFKKHREDYEKIFCSGDNNVK